MLKYHYDCKYYSYFVVSWNSAVTIHWVNMVVVNFHLEVLIIHLIVPS